MDIVRLCWKNGVSGKFNPIKYCGIIIWDKNPLVGVIQF